MLHWLANVSFFHSLWFTTCPSQVIYELCGVSICFSFPFAFCVIHPLFCICHLSSLVCFLRIDSSRSIPAGFKAVTGFVFVFKRLCKRGTTRSRCCRSKWSSTQRKWKGMLCSSRSWKSHWRKIKVIPANTSVDWSTWALNSRLPKGRCWRPNGPYNWPNEMPETKTKNSMTPLVEYVSMSRWVYALTLTFMATF